MRKAQTVAVFVIFLVISAIGIYVMYKAGPSIGEAIGGAKACGNGIVQPDRNEECEPGNLGVMLENALCLDTDCNRRCKCPEGTTGSGGGPRPAGRPGDGIVQPRGFCGDGKPDPGEQCGDKGTLGCASTETCDMTTCVCVPAVIPQPAPSPIPPCGNGVADKDEECNEPGLKCPDGQYCENSLCRCFPIPGWGEPVPTGDSGSDGVPPSPGTTQPGGDTLDDGPDEPSYCGDGKTDKDPPLRIKKSDGSIVIADPTRGEECDPKDVLTGVKCWINGQEGSCDEKCKCNVGAAGIGAGEGLVDTIVTETAWYGPYTCTFGIDCPALQPCSMYPEINCPAGISCMSWQDGAVVAYYTCG